MPNVKYKVSIDNEERDTFWELLKEYRACNHTDRLNDHGVNMIKQIEFFGQKCFDLGRLSAQLPNKLMED